MKVRELFDILRNFNVMGNVLISEKDSEGQYSKFKIRMIYICDKFNHYVIRSSIKPSKNNVLGFKVRDFIGFPAVEEENGDYEAVVLCKGFNAYQIEKENISLDGNNVLINIR